MAEIGCAERKFPGNACIAVLGLGHVGLPTALGLAELGWNVIGADEVVEKVNRLKAGDTSFYEPDLQPLLSKHLLSGRFRPTTDVAAAVRSARVIFICVGTPQRENGAPDLSQVEAVTRIIAGNLNGYKLIVEKSTVPAITAQWIKKTIERFARDGSRSGDGVSQRAMASEASFDVASNPEFLQEGKAVENFFHPNRIVLGIENQRARAILEELYQPLNCPTVLTNPTTAELIKHAANAFLATKISFINMVADVCDSVGADVEDVARGIGLDPRIGAAFLRAGIGFGGYCFPKDLRAFIHLAKEHEVECSILESVERVNHQRIDIFLKKVRQALWVVRGKTIAALGLAFKPGTDDLREAPSLKVIEALLKEGASLRVYDPEVTRSAQLLFREQPGRVAYCSSPYEAARGADALMILTEWDEFLSLNLNRIKDLMEVPIIFDGRNIFDPAAMVSEGFEYHCMGRGPIRVTGGEVSSRSDFREALRYGSKDDSPVSEGAPNRARPLRALIMGGAGFVGSHLCDRLVAEGYEVICLDNLLTGRRSNVEHLLKHPKFTLVEYDITKPIDLSKILAASRIRAGLGNGLEKIDYILQFASPASPKDYARHPIHTLKVGALGTYHALGLAKAHDSVFLLASTSEVYGDPEMSPQPETYRGSVNPIGPRSVYDEAKRFAEAITMAYCREHGVKVRIARIFNTYGERMRLNDGRVLPNFITSALQNKPLTVYGDGSQTRSYCYVSDLVEGLYRLLLSNETAPVNLGNPDELSVLDLAHRVIEHTGSKSTLLFEPLPVDDPVRRRPDISRAVAALGWKPAISLSAGLQKVIPYFDAALSEESGRPEAKTLPPAAGPAECKAPALAFVSSLGSVSAPGETNDESFIEDAT